MNNCQSLKDVVSLHLRREAGQFEESFVISVEAMRPLEDAGKNGWTMADFSVMMLIKHFLGQPDPSPIETVWDMMGRRLHLPGNVDDLSRQLEQIWQEIPQETIRILYHSLSRRVATFIQARSGSTPY
ncbi:transposable element Tcb1 transposase [Trichonephila clavipes]|nr:transposable element Tcb1 transposase [Trichonephila clavipes]